MLAKRETAPNTFLELAKIILGSWPSFGLLLMLLFYIGTPEEPIRGPERWPCLAGLDADSGAAP